MTQDYSANNKRVVKNTMMLYFRMLLLMGVGLYTSRVLLKALGVENYGIQNVVSGFLSMFGIITSSMSAAISRYITVELGKNQFDRLKSVFATSVAVQIVMGLILVIAIETIGLWYIENKMNIPAGREEAALWCLHFATITMFIGLMNIPFNSAIVAHEKMSAFAYMSILDAMLKLGICFAIIASPFDKLKTYACLLTCVSMITTSIYWLYCKLHFSETTFIPKFNKGLFKEIWSFAGWNFFGNTSWILNTQGVNMVLNFFFGVVVNAARGIANQVNGVLQQFVSNFMMALNPQIIKTYSSGDKEYAYKLACMGARCSFFIMFLIALPVMIEADNILQLWLDSVPKQSNEFLILTIISTFILMLGNTLVTLQNAHGNIRHYQLWITIWGCLPFPLTWLFFEFGAPAIYAYYIYIAVYWCLMFVRYYLVHQSTGIPAQMYLKGVLFKCHVVGIVSCAIPLYIHYILPPSFLRLCVVVLCSLLVTSLVIYYYGMEKNEKELINRAILKFRKKIITKQ